METYSEREISETELMLIGNIQGYLYTKKICCGYNQHSMHDTQEKCRVHTHFYSPTFFHPSHIAVLLPLSLPAISSFTPSPIFLFCLPHYPEHI